MMPKLEDVDPDDAFSSVPYEKGFNFLWYLEVRQPSLQRSFNCHACSRTRTVGSCSCTVCEQKLVGGEKLMNHFLKAHCDYFGVCCFDSAFTQPIDMTLSLAVLCGVFGRVEGLLPGLFQGQGRRQDPGHHRLASQSSRLDLSPSRSLNRLTSQGHLVQQARHACGGPRVQPGAGQRGAQARPRARRVGRSVYRLSLTSTVIKLVVALQARRRRRLRGGRALRSSCSSSSWRRCRTLNTRRPPG